MADNTEPVFAKLKTPERSRTYVFPTGKVVIHDVVALSTPAGRSHRIETADGRKFIVPPGWLAIELDMDAWTY